MEQDKLNDFSASVPDPDTYSYFKLDYLKRKIADKNTNLTKLAKATKISYSSLQKYRQNPDNLLKCGVQNYRTLTLCLNPYEENNEMLKKLGFSNSEISNRGLVQNKIERYIVKHGNFAYTKTDTQQNISLIMLSTLFSLMDADDFILNIVLKNVINNLDYIDHEY